MTISLTRTPVNTRNPGVYAEFDGSPASTGQPNQATLLIGQKTPTGTAIAGQPILLISVPQAKAACGAGSQLALMAAQYLTRDPGNDAPTWLLPLNDDPAAVAASGAVEFGGTATASGTLPLMVDGQPVFVAVPVGMTASQLAVSVTLQAAQQLDLPATATADGPIVNWTANNKGQSAGQLDIRIAYRGAAGGEAIPPGITATVVPIDGGTGNPIAGLTSALAGLGDRLYDFIVLPYSDSASLDTIKGFLDETNGRWAPFRLLFGHAFAAYRMGTANGVADVTSYNDFSSTRNDQHVTLMPFWNVPQSAALWAADLTGSIAVSVRDDPGVPLQYLPMGVLPPPRGAEFDFSTRNTLEYSGGATFTVAEDGTVTTSRLVTTYQHNAAGAPDTAWLDTETPYQLADVARFLTYDLKTVFARKKLLPDGTRFGPGQAAVTPAIIKAHEIAKYRQLEEAGKVSNSAYFAKNIIVEIAQVGQVRMVLPITLADQLRQIMMLITFAK